MLIVREKAETTMTELHDINKAKKVNQHVGNIIPMILVACLLLLAPPTALAQTPFDGSLKAVSITDAAGNNNPPAAIFSYTQEGETFAFDASGSSDPDGSVSKYQWDFDDGTTGSGSTFTYKYSGTESFQVTLTVIDDAGGVTISQMNVEVNIAAAFDMSISFQKATDSAPPEGFIIDKGGSFDSSSSGYGWTVAPSSSGLRDRNNTQSPDQAYDTFIHVKPNAVWELEVPNGNYNVTICVGDPSYPQGLHVVQAEGTSVINGTLSKDTLWLEQTVNVRVDDGRLTISFTGSEDPAKLNWIRVSN
jgi:hypothetical protein